MKLLGLTLQDFRQFRGRQKIEFAGDGQRNTTLIYGPNGGGKTTILNAFVWVLYGTFTDDFEQPERLIHGDTWVAAASGSKLSASVELRFEHERKRYELIREVATTKDAPEQNLRDRKGSLRLLVTDESGATTEPKNPADQVDRILPQELHKFFFFNGERIENLTRHTAYRQLAEATKSLLGLEVVERAIAHLPKAGKTFESKLAQLGDPRNQDIKAELDHLRDQLEALTVELATAEENGRANEDRREAVFAELARHSESRALQERRKAARDRLAESETRLRRIRGDISALISKSGFMAFTETLGSKVAARFADLEERGELPAPVKEPFVRELLDRGVCICGTALTEGSVHRKELEAFLRTAGSPELEALWTHLHTLTRRLPDDRSTFQSDLARLLTERDAAAQARREANEAESEVERELKGIDNVDVQALEDEQRRIGEVSATIQQRIGRLQSESRRLTNDIEAAEKALTKQDQHDTAAQELQRCVLVARDATATLKRIQDVLTEGVRQQLNTRIASTYDKISARRRFPELLPNFELRLYEEDQDGTKRLAPNSTSENTILALSFVGGLAHYARDQGDGKIGDASLQQLLEGGGTFPIVVDAAFGSLDETYKIEVARALPKLTEQLVTLLSKAQAEGTADELASHVGRTYVIVSYVSKEHKDEDVEVDGRPYPYRRVCDGGQERTEVLEIT